MGFELLKICLEITQVTGAGRWTPFFLHFLMLSIRNISIILLGLVSSPSTL